MEQMHLVMALRELIKKLSFLSVFLLYLDFKRDETAAFAENSESACHQIVVQ